MNGHRHCVYTQIHLVSSHQKERTDVIDHNVSGTRQYCVKRNQTYTESEVSVVLTYIQKLKKYNFLEEDSEILIQAREGRGRKCGGKQDNNA